MSFAHLIKPPAIKPTGGRIVRKLYLVGEKVHQLPPKVHAAIDRRNDGGTILSCLVTSPGSTRADLQAHLGWPKYRVADALTQLHLDGRVRLSQAKRIRRWYVA